MANEFKVLDLATGKVMLVAETDGSDMLLVIEFSPDAIESSPRELRRGTAA